MRIQFKAKLTVPRPSHTKKPEVFPAFQASCRERLQGVIPREHTRPVRVFSHDDSRGGVLTVRRRRLTAQGVQLVGLVQHTFEWFDIYGAVAPTTGERYCLERPYLNAETFQLFIDAFAHTFPDSLPLWLLDHSGVHTAQHIRWPEHVRCVWLPPYGPALNPMERVWRALKDQLAWVRFTDLDTQQLSMGAVWQDYDAPTLQTLAGYPYLVEAIHVLCS